MKMEIERSDIYGAEFSARQWDERDARQWLRQHGFGHFGRSYGIAKKVTKFTWYAPTVPMPWAPKRQYKVRVITSEVDKRGHNKELVLLAYRGLPS